MLPLEGQVCQLTEEAEELFSAASLWPEAAPRTLHAIAKDVSTSSLVGAAAPPGPSMAAPQRLGWYRLCHNSHLQGLYGVVALNATGGHSSRPHFYPILVVSHKSPFRSAFDAFSSTCLTHERSRN